MPPAVEPRPTAVKALSPNHWTVREFPGNPYFNVVCEIRTETVKTRKTLGMRFQISMFGFELWLGRKLRNWKFLFYALGFFLSVTSRKTVLFFFFL